MKDFSIHCNICHEECLLKNEYVYMHCPCHEDTRIFPFIDIKYQGEDSVVYLLKTTESESYATMEIPP